MNLRRNQMTTLIPIVKRLWWVWLAAFAPAAASLVLGLLFEPYFLLQATPGGLVCAVGVLFSLAALGAIALWTVAERRQEQAIYDEREREAATHWRFVSALDHEIKNPLTAICTSLDNLAGSVTEEERQRVIRKVDLQARRLGRLAADLLKLSELATQPLERTPVDIRQLLDEVAALASQRAGADERRLELRVPRASPMPPVSGDRDLLFQAVYNLVDNAIKFTRPGGLVEVSASAPEAAVFVQVADTGPGIPDEERPHIFEELYRGKDARGIEGSGLGLALVKAVVERHGGTVTVRSRPGQGTEFTVRLPAD